MKTEYQRMDDETGSAPSPPAQPTNVVFNRYASFLLGVSLCLCAGTLYGWSAVNKEIKAKMDYDGQQINLVNSIGLLGMYFGFPCGMMYDRFGPMWTALYASALAFTGYFLMYLQISTKFTTSHLAMGFFFAIAGQGSIGMYYSALLTNVRNFQAKNRGVIVGLMASGFGLSSAMFTAVYKGFFLASKDVEHYLLTLSLVLSILTLFAAFTLRITGPPPEAPAVLLPSVVEVEASSEATKLLHTSQNNEEEQVLSVQRNKANEAEEVDMEGKVDITGVDLLKNMSYVLIFFANALTCGSGLMAIGNISLLGESNGFNSDQSLVLVSLLSYANCSGRLLSGLVSDALKKYFSRAFFIGFWVTVMGTVHLIMAFSQGQFLYVFAVCVGLAYGGMFSTGPTFISEQYGVKNFGFNTGVTFIGLAGTSTLYNQISGRIYDSHAGADKKCFGQECFASVFFFTFAGNFLSLILVAFLSMRTRKRSQIL